MALFTWSSKNVESSLFIDHTYSSETAAFYPRLIFYVHPSYTARDEVKCFIKLFDLIKGPFSFILYLCFLFFISSSFMEYDSVESCNKNPALFP